MPLVRYRLLDPRTFFKRPMSNSGIHAELKHSASLARAWLFDHALPLWWQRGFDRATGCFVEALDQDGATIASPLRVRVQARQTIVYAVAGQLGWEGPWRAAVEAGLKTCMERCLRADGGVRHLLAPDGAPLDDRRDLYDTAFVIFAFALAGRLLGRADAIDAAGGLVQWVEANWSDTSGGFAEGDVSPCPPRRQNPHMHLFEALLALVEASGDAAHLERASALAELFQTKLFDPKHGALTEYFDANWRPMPDRSGCLVEPGHLFEWSWLLHRWQGLGGRGFETEAERLRAFGEGFGVDEAGFVRDEILINGPPDRTSSRLWTNTERLKANLARFERTGDTEAARDAHQAFAAIMKYCDLPLTGLWRDVHAPGRGFARGPAPASSFYHIILAFSELMRVADFID